MSTPILSPVKTIATVNIDLLAAVGCWFASSALWPTTYEWWGLSLISIMFGAGVPLCIIDAVKCLWRYWRQKAAIDAFHEGRSAPKSARLADERRMDEMGMFR